MMDVELQETAKSGAPAVDFAFRILHILVQAGYPLTLTEICERVPISAGSGHRILKELVRQNVVAPDFSKRKAYSIGPAIFQITSAVYEKQRLIPYFYPGAEILKNEIGQSVCLSVPLGNTVVMVAKVDPLHVLPMQSYIGQAFPLHQAAAGKVILAMRTLREQQYYIRNEPSLRSMDSSPLLEELRHAYRVGYAITKGEIYPGVGCIAAPVLNLQGEALAAIHVAVALEDMEEKMIRLFSQHLIQAARQLSSNVGIL